MIVSHGGAGLDAGCGVCFGGIWALERRGSCDDARGGWGAERNFFTKKVAKNFWVRKFRVGLADGNLVGVKAGCGIAVDGGVGYNRAGAIGLGKGDFSAARRQWPEG